MSRSPASLAFVLWTTLALVQLSACTDPGLPWGWLEATVQARFDPPEGRLDDEGRLKTSANYALALDTVEVTLDALTLALAGAGAADFDPANPPEGYSLCHNGHCHSASGALVDYEVIALEMAGGADGARVTLGLDGEPRSLGADAVSVDVKPCDPSPCALPRGEMAALELTVTSLRVVGTAFDSLTGEDARLPSEGAAFEADVQVAAPIVVEVEGTIGPGEPVGVRLDLDFALPPELFDDVDFAEAPPADGLAWQALLVAALMDHGGLEVAVARTQD
ncbi:MAG: hypothetical protein QF464_11720 [Myxococcota bacterium]|nr:hypothetical protein [Myxococcota bacterium]